MGQLRAAIYTRVSTADQNCDRQVGDLETFAARAGYDVVGIWRETAPGTKDQRPERKAILALAQARKIDVILVTELTRWGRSMVDLVHSLESLQARNVSLIAQTGVQFELATSQGKLIAGVMATLAEFERDLLRERVKSGLAAAKARGKRLGRAEGQCPSDRHAPKVLRMLVAGMGYREIARDLHLSKNTVAAIAQRHKVAG
jgi:DNA invertase Pin-like site-specific DNA recombinase